MADLNVNFMHPTDGRTISVTVENTMTGQEAIAELIANEFIPTTPDGYNLAIKGGAQLENNKTLAQGGVKDNDTLRIIPATDAGADLSVNFMHPIDGRVTSVTVDDSMTGQEAIAELIACDFISATPDGYSLGIKGGAMLENSKTLAQSGVKDNDTLRILPSTDAGNNLKI